ncbi:putative DD41D transposase [Trichonephila clavipes]|nr:putative DD41D transposase [Trichonephila clavipes]
MYSDIMVSSDINKGQLIITRCLGKETVYSMHCPRAVVVPTSRKEWLNCKMTTHRLAVCSSRCTGDGLCIVRRDQRTTTASTTSSYKVKKITLNFLEKDEMKFAESKIQFTKHCCQVIYSQFGLAIHQKDHQARRRFVEWAQNEIAVVPDFHKRILFSDEAHFWLNGYVNKQNCRIWSESNPQVYVETPLHPEKLTVWCALWAGGILLQKR